MYKQLDGKAERNCYHYQSYKWEIFLVAGAKGSLMLSGQVPHL
jgi:hypothetical protein